jgi:hypothetical protein
VRRVLGIVWQNWKYGRLAVANATFGNRRFRILTVTCRTLAHCAIIVDCSW